MRKLSLLAVSLFLVPSAALATSEGWIQLRHASSPDNRNINMKFHFNGSSVNVKTGQQVLELKYGTATTNSVAQQLWMDGMPTNSSATSSRKYVTYCIDFRDHTTGQFDWYEVISPLSSGPDTYPMGTTKAAQLSWLWDEHFVDSLGSEVAAAAFQAATWEIINETSANAFDIWTGDFRYSGGTPNSSQFGALSLADTWVDQAASRTGYVSPASFYVLTDTKYQDYVYLTRPVPTAPPVPEPMTMVSLASAVLAAGAYLKRRRKA